MDKYPELREEFQKLITNEEHIEFFKEWGNVEIIKKPQYAKGVMEEVLRICNENNYLVGKAWSLGFIGWHYNDTAEYDKSVDYQLEAYRIFYDAGNEKGQIYTANGLMIAYFQLGFYELSIQYGTNALEVARRIDDEKYIVIIINNICLNYTRAHKYEEAKSIMGDLWNSHYVDNDIVKVSMYQTMAEVEYQIGSLDKAMKFIDDSIEIINKADIKAMKGDSYRIRGMVNGKLGNEIEAKANFDKALNIAQNENCKDVYGYTLIEYAKFYNERGFRHTKAIESLLKALEVSKEIKCNLLIKDIYNELYKTYKKMGEFKEALVYYEKYNSIENMLNSNDNNARFSSFEGERNKYEVTLYKSLYNEINMLSNIGQKITSNLNFDNILANTNKEISMIMKAGIVGIGKLNEEMLEYAIFIDLGENSIVEKVSIYDEQSLGAYCFRNKCTLLINDINKDYKKYITEINKVNFLLNSNSAMYCPLIIEDKVIGVLNIQSYEKNAYTENDLNKLKILGSYVAIALENSYLYNQTKYFASHDYLTGLLSRKEIFKQGEEIFKKCSESNKRVASIMIDVDNFKSVNDRYGHSAGDSVLRAIGGIINNVVGEYGLSGRYGGEEILVILPEISKMKIYSIAEEIRQAIESKEISDEITSHIHVTASLGIFISEGKEKNIENCIKYADEALYIAKAEGKNRIVKYENYI
ncbi:MAG: sensor domain-containing diguanylate cyclase [Clostridium sp.]|uniref:sensor domain-containing diguanylate cyclase n=1 Tax=Clostridium sp. TaxID=1506 RepID=UPI0030390805